MWKAIITSLVALLFVTSVAAGFSTPSPVAPPGLPFQTDEEVTEEEGQETDDDGLDAAQGPADLTFVEELVAEKVAHAAERAAAAQAHAGAIMEWTDCIAANAANPEDEPRDDTFDPKVGCEELRPEPPADPNENEADIDPEGGPPDEPGAPTDAGPPDEPGAPTDAGPPDWVPGPPPSAGDQGQEGNGPPN